MLLPQQMPWVCAAFDEIVTNLAIAEKQYARVDQQVFEPGEGVRKIPAANSLGIANALPALGAEGEPNYTGRLSRYCRPLVESHLEPRRSGLRHFSARRDSLSNLPGLKIETWGTRPLPTGEGKGSRYSVNKLAHLTTCRHLSQIMQPSSHTRADRERTSSPRPNQNPCSPWVRRSE